MGSLWRSLPGSWQEKLLVLLGFILMASPWLLGYAGSANPTGNAVVIGLVYVVGGGVAIVLQSNYANYVVAFLAYWLALAARILGYESETIPMLVDIGFGVAGIVLAMWAAILRARSENGSDGTVRPFEPPSQPTPKEPGRKAA